MNDLFVVCPLIIVDDDYHINNYKLLSVYLREPDLLLIIHGQYCTPLVAFFQFSLYSKCGNSLHLSMIADYIKSNLIKASAVLL